MEEMAEMETIKKEWMSPEVVTYGRMEDITQFVTKDVGSDDGTWVCGLGEVGTCDNCS